MAERNLSAGMTFLQAVAPDPPLCAVADCVRVASRTVMVEGMNGHVLDDPLPIKVCLPCIAYYGLTATPECADE